MSDGVAKGWDIVPQKRLQVAENREVPPLLTKPVRQSLVTITER